MTKKQTPYDFKEQALYDTAHDLTVCYETLINLYFDTHPVFKNQNISGYQTCSLCKAKTINGTDKHKANCTLKKAYEAIENAFDCIIELDKALAKKMTNQP